MFAPLFQIALHGFDLDIMMGYMTKNRAQKKFGEATLAGVKKEMAKPCIAKSARKNYANLTLSLLSTEVRETFGHSKY